MQFLSKNVGNEQIPTAQLAFVGHKLRNDLHDLLLTAFRDEGITQSELAQRTGINKAQISRWLGAPGNLTIDTVAKLLFAINGSLIAVATCDADAAGLANFTQPSWMVGKLPPVSMPAAGSHAVVAIANPRAIVSSHTGLANNTVGVDGKSRNSTSIRIAAE